ncbi:protein MTL1 [Scaptodrosophila lebanonensis]|uniref:Protein MTL1 n=1 Tax=Drosophila lebanonensis TaxID=7225 RepID=A0A6J2TVP3_DROLE|nr:protein MTL1 [Scaptodrosophila lebanonensis]
MVQVAMTTTTTNSAINTTMITRRGKFSVAFSMLLLCIALLLNKSCGIVALSTEGSGALAVGTDAWSGITTAGLDSDSLTTTTEENNESGSGSGIGLTTDVTIEDLTTTTASPDEETTTSANDVNEEDSTTTSASPDEETTTAANDVNNGDSTTTTTSPDEETTTSANDVNNGDSTTTTTSPDEETSTAANEEISTNSPDEPASTTTEPNNSDGGAPIDTTTVNSGNAEDSDPITTTTSSGNANGQEPVTTTLVPEASTIAPTPPAPPVFECQSTGHFAHLDGDCRRYYNCLLDALTGQLVALEQVCPPLTAFTPLYGRCTRDLAACSDDGFNCTAVGRFSGSDDSHYYNCVPSLLGGLHKYRVRCSIGQRFEPVLGRCWRYDWTQLTPGSELLESSDLAAIKREQKAFKAEEKLRQKVLKQQEKLALKQQKELEKQAKKAAKEQAKQQAKQEKEKEKNKNKVQSAESEQSEEDTEWPQQLGPQPENFQCSREGNYPRQNPQQFFACVSQNGQLLTLALECRGLHIFDAQIGACTPSNE